jgi:hypothetical protein
VTVVGVMLGSAFPQIVLWRPELVQINNDTYRFLIGTMHPDALVMPIRECWPVAIWSSAWAASSMRGARSV